MNNYEVTRCKCGEVTITSLVGSVKVAGSKNLEQVFEQLRSKSSVQDVAASWCSWCLFPKSSHLNANHEFVSQNNTYV